jgi:hypothetical protein
LKEFCKAIDVKKGSPQAAFHIATLPWGLRFGRAGGSFVLAPLSSQSALGCLDSLLPFSSRRKERQKMNSIVLFRWEKELNLRALDN